MNRRFVAAAWIAGTTLSLLAAAVFCFACCVLPFHATIHNLMPGCEIPAHLTNHGPEADDQKAQPPSTEPQKQEPIKRLATVLSSGARIPVLSAEQRPFFAKASGAYRKLHHARRSPL